MKYTDGLTCEYGRDCLCMDGHRWKCIARVTRPIIHPGNQHADLTPSSVETQSYNAQSDDLRLKRKGSSY